MSSPDEPRPPQEPLLELAMDVSDGVAVDWDKTREQHPDLAETLGELRVIQSVFHEYHREPVDQGDGAEPPPTPGAPTAGPPAERVIFTWGNLDALEKLGEGAFGEVWRAWDRQLQREVALKLRRVEQHGRDATRWLEEARRLARVRHPHVLTVHGADVHDGRAGIWTDLLHGRTLEQLLTASGPLGAREAALIGMDLCAALSAVHSAGLIHGDVKTRNVMREGDAERGTDAGRIVLLDFGAADESSPELATPVAGTPLYIAPEVLEGGTQTPAADLYAVGVLLYRIVTKRFPVSARNLEQLRAAHARGQHEPLRTIRPELPPAYIQVVERALARDPAQRFHDAAQMERALAAVLGVAASPPAQVAPRRNARWWLQRVAPVVGVGALMGYLGWQLRSAPAAPKPLPAPYADAPSQVLVGEAHSIMFGLAATGVGDVDQDGFDDVLVGAPHSAEAAYDGGKVFLFHGSRSGLDPRPAWTAACSEKGALLGWSMTARTSLNQDGFGDFAIGAPGTYDTTQTVGRVFVYLGSRSGPPSDPSQVLSADRPGTRFGYALASGDVDHDGDDDLLVGEPEYPSPTAGSGRAVLYRANGNEYIPTPIWIVHGPANSRFGTAVSLGGDVNNDGFRDAVIGALTASFGKQQSESGGAYVYLGSRAGLDTIPIVLPGRQRGALTGRDVLIPGDVDGDGYADVAVGSEEASNPEAGEGVVEIYFGSKAGVNPYGSVSLEPNVMGANFGGHLGALGDADGDGRTDLFVGASRYQRAAPREGAGFVFRGAVSRSFQRIWYRYGGKDASWYGSCGGAAGDVDGDGRPDLFVTAAAWDDTSGPNAGKVEIFLHRR